MKSYRKVLLALVFIINGCTIIENVDENGVLWEYYTVTPITIGIETFPMNNLIIFADEANTLYALDAGSGLLRWKISPPLTITTILPLNNTLYLIGYSNTGLQGGVIYTLDVLNGAIVTQRSFPLQPLPNRYLLTGDGAVLYSSNQAVIISNNGSLSTTYSLENGILALQRIGSDYFALLQDASTSTKIQRYTSSFAPISAATDSSTPTGSFFLWNTTLYVGTTSKLLRSDPSPSLSVFKSFPVKSEMTGTSSLLFIPLAEIGNGGIRAYNLTGNEVWFSPTYASISYVPLVYNSSYQVVFSIDDNGNLGVYDANNGRLLFQRYFGTIQKNGLKLPLDLYQNYIFIPFSIPAKLVCFSMRHASTGP